ncbi:MAG: hypothetical protein QXZ31_03850 [Thermofilaceae archaeon]
MSELKTVEVAIVHVKHPDTRSPIRRLIYYVLEREAYLSDLGWVVPRKETVVKIERLAERAGSVEGVNEAVKIYWVRIPATLLEELMREKEKRSARRGGRAVAQSG